MSRIFDALQRSEGERSGVDLSTLTAATELLQLVERQSVSEWETKVAPERSDAAENTKRDASPSVLPSSVAAATVGGLGAAEPSLTDKQLGQFAQFQPRQISFGPQSQLVSLRDDDSLAAENFRFLGMRLRHLRRERALKKVLITSTIPHEGKSMVAANLACTLARKKQQRVVLLEGDLRRPALSQVFGLSPIPGICEWLQGDQQQIENIYRLEGPHLENSGLWIFPAGSALDNPLELLQSARLSTLMDQLTILFDWIIIDSPPVLPLADTSVWSRWADGIVLVTRQGITEKQHLKRGLEALDHKKLIGALLNSSQSSALNDHYYYRPDVVSRPAGRSKK